VIISLGGFVFIGDCYHQHYYAKTAELIPAKLDGKVEHGPRKKPLGVGGNLDDVRLGLE